MAHPRSPEPHPAHLPVYQIRLTGHLGPRFADWFDGLTLILLDNGETLLTGPVIDQSALFAVLRKVRDVGLPLVSVVRVPSDLADATVCQRDT